MKKRILTVFLALFTVCLSVSAVKAETSGKAPLEAPGGMKASKLKSPANGADYIVISPAAFESTLKPLLDHRKSEGLRVVLVTPTEIEKEFGIWSTGTETIRSFMRYAYFNWAKPAPKYLLLVGDAPALGATATAELEVPTGLFRTVTEFRDRYKTPKGEPKKYGPVELIASDMIYTEMDGDGLPDLAEGRLPADNTDELKTMIDKILAYETHPPTGIWKRRISFFASEGHFGSIDQLLEKMFKTMVKTNISPKFDLNMTYANPKMPYLFVPDRFNEKVIDRFNEGSLFINYIGHGLTDQFDDVNWNGKKYPIMEMGDVGKIDAGGKTPFLVVVACLVGNFDSVVQDSIGEALIKKAGGPVGVISASMVSQPTPNGLLSREIAQAVFTKMTPRIGDVLLDAKRGTILNTGGEDRKIIDKFAETIYKKDDIVRHNSEGVLMYNLLGDPATKIAYPAGEVSLKAPDMVVAGNDINVSGTVSAPASGKVTITLESSAVNVIYPIKPIEGLEGKELDKTVEENYANANNKTAWEKTIDYTGGKFSVSISAPDWLPRAVYYIKAYAFDAAGKDAFGDVSIKIDSAK
ncbi:MAG TPA: C25 family cysteine peptidase [bacterium]|nr:C25 family cysteine peptidase [bacterium]